MMRFLTDEDFDYDIVRGVLRFVPDLDIETVQELSLTNVDDTILLTWAVQDNRVILTHDVNTMNGFALNRVRVGLPMPGVVVVRKLAPIGLSISDLVYVVQAGNENDFRDQVRYIPL